MDSLNNFDFIIEYSDVEDLISIKALRFKGLPKYYTPIAVSRMHGPGLARPRACTSTCKTTRATRDDAREHGGTAAWVSRQHGRRATTHVSTAAQRHGGMGAALLC